MITIELDLDPANGLPAPRSEAEWDCRVRCLQSLASASMTSGGRTEKRNAFPSIGGHKNSWHLISRGPFAADLVCDNASLLQRSALAEMARQLGIEAIVYMDHVHLEMPSGTYPPPVRMAA